MPLSLNLDLNILGVLGYLLASTTLKAGWGGGRQGGLWFKNFCS